MSDATGIVTARRGGIAWITIDRADKANALTIAMMAALSGQIRTVGADDSLKALVLTGAGQRVFSGGVDVRTATDYPPDAARELRSQRFFELLGTLARLPKPVVVGLNGVASGGGAMLALLADRLVAAENAVLALPEIDLGAPTFAGLAILAHAAGAALASDLVQTGRRMSANEALAHGLVAAVVGFGELVGRAEQEARLLASKPASAFALNKEWLRRPLLAALHLAEQDTRRLRASVLALPAQC